MKSLLIFSCKQFAYQQNSRKIARSWGSHLHGKCFLFLKHPWTWLCILFEHKSMPKKTPSSKKQNYQQTLPKAGKLVWGLFGVFFWWASKEFLEKTLETKTPHATSKKNWKRDKTQVNTSKTRQNLEMENWAQASKPSLKVIQQKKLMNRK